MKREERRKLEKRLDELWGQIIRSVGKCEHCGSNKNLQAAHIASRKYKSMRWELKNGICMCSRCHLFWAHKEPIDFANWLKENYPEKYQFVLEKDKQIGKKVDLEEKLKELSSHEEVRNISDYQKSVKEGIINLTKHN